MQPMVFLQPPHQIHPHPLLSFYIYLISIIKDVLAVSYRMQSVVIARALQTLIKLHDIFCTNSAISTQIALPFQAEKCTYNTINKPITQLQEDTAEQKSIKQADKESAVGERFRQTESAVGERFYHLKITTARSALHQMGRA